MRNFWSDLKIPTDIGRELANIPKEVAKEVTKAMMAQTDRIKDEALLMVSEELRKFTDNLDIGEEIRKALRNSTIEMELKIRFREDEPEPEIKQEVSLVPVLHSPDKASSVATAFSDAERDEGKEESAE